MTRLDPDPLRPDDEDDGWLWDPTTSSWVPRPSGLIALLVGLALGVVIGFLFAVGVVRAAPRAESLPSIPVADAAQLGAPSSFVGTRSAPERPDDAETGAPPTPATGSKHGPSPAILSGLASWCAPTRTHCQGWGGNAHLAAVPTFHDGDRPYLVRVTYHRRSTVVLVVSFCACGTKIIDLSPAAFDDLAPLSLGVIRVSVRRLAGPGSPPSTDIGQ